MVTEWNPDSRKRGGLCFWKLFVIYKEDIMTAEGFQNYSRYRLICRPGGLGEGFAALDRKEGKKYFKIDFLSKWPFCSRYVTPFEVFSAGEYEDVPPEYYAFLVVK